MNNLHLVPEVVIDIVKKLNEATRENERTAYIMRLEAIRDFCDLSLTKKTETALEKAFKKART